MLREQARKFLAGRCLRQAVREAFEGGAGYDLELRAEITRGSGVGTDGLCVLAEKLDYGRSEGRGRSLFGNGSSREA
jgi:hypothetical protein